MKDAKLRRLHSLLFLLCFLPLTVWAQSLAIKGVVYDSTGEPIIGASVLEKGTTNGIITDLDGNFSLQVKKGAVLVVSFIGYKTQEVVVNSVQSLKITLLEDAKALDEVVVIGYGTARRSDVTGSIASVQSDKLREVPATNITYALQSRIAGVDMSQTSSKPGANMQIRIRGTRSLNASNDPLVVLDGIPFMGNLSDINPNDIKSMDILKDASSTAIYGSRGANGVILITTFKGAEGSSAKVSYNGYFGIKDIFAKYPMMNGEEFVKLRKLAGKYTNGVDESDDVNTDWQDLLYKTGIVTSHDVGVAGGTKGGSYSFGAGYYRDEAVIPTQSYDRYSIRGSFDQGVGKYFRFGLSTNTNYNITQGSQIGIYNVLSASPISNPYNEDGSLKRTIQMPLDTQFLLTKSVIEGLDDSWINEAKALGTYNTLFAEVKTPWIEGLKYRINLGLNYRTSETGSYTGEGVNSTTADTPSTASITNTRTTNWAVEHLLSYDNTFADKHRVNVVAMFSAEQTVYHSSNIAAKDVPADYFQYYNLGRANGEITVNPDYQNYQKSGLMSWMGRAMYSYDDKYMLMATVRSDASSRLAKGHQWHTYPAISAGWNIKKEGFMNDVAVIDALKLRVGYGQTSNQAVDPYSTLGLLSTRPYNFGDAYATGYYVSKLPNPELGWEYSSTWNFGVDFSLFNGRLSGTMEYYIQKTSDLLLSVNMPSTSGVGSYMGNIGKTENKGIELTLNGIILNNYNGWTWEAGINLYANRNKLTELASKSERDVSNQWFVGSPIDVIYDYKKIGLWQEGDPYFDVLEPGERNLGMIKVEYTGEYDDTGKPVRAIGEADRQVISMEPNFQGGFNTRVAYKGFDLSVVGAFKNGGKLISSLYSSNGYLNMLSGRRGNVKVDYWTPENTDAKYPKPGGVMSGDNPKYGSTLGYFSASYMKIRTITLGYNFANSKWIKNLGVESLRAYVTVQNPFVFFSPYKDESGMDPETNSYGNENAAVALPDNLKRLLTIGTNTPSTRNYLFGVNLTF